MKTLIVAIMLVGGLSLVGSLYWISKCINLDTVTYGDSEAANYNYYLRQTGKILQKPKQLCASIDIPSHIRKYD